MISLSENAVSKIKQLWLPRSPARVCGSRWSVADARACSTGWKSTIAKERDKIFERDGAQLIVDKKSFLYLERLGTRLLAKS